MRKCVYEAWGEYKCSNIKEGFEEENYCGSIKNTLSDLQLKCPENKVFKDDNIYTNEDLNDTNKILDICCKTLENKSENAESCTKYEENGYMCPKGYEIEKENNCTGLICNENDNASCCKKTKQCRIKEKELINKAEELESSCINYVPEIKKMIGTCSDFPGTCPEDSILDEDELCYKNICTLDDINICCKKEDIKKGLCYEGIGGKCNDYNGVGITKDECLLLEENIIGK